MQSKANSIFFAMLKSMLPLEPSWQKTMVIRDEKTAELLAQGTHTINILAPFLGRENSTKAAADETGIKLNVLAYWVHKFFDAGILIRTRTLKRRGRPVHFYRAAADEFFVPVNLIANASDAELLARVQQQEYEAFTRNAALQGRKLSQQWCLHYCMVDGLQRWTMLPLEDIPPERLLERPLHDWLHLDLSEDTVKSLRQELWALMTKYQALNGQGSRRKRITLHLGLAEMNREM